MVERADHGIDHEGMAGIVTNAVQGGEGAVSLTFLKCLGQGDRTLNRTDPVRPAVQQPHRHMR